MEAEHVVQTLGFLVALFTSLGGMFKSRNDYNKTKIHFDKRLTSQLRGFENAMMELRKDFNASNVDLIFRKKLRNTISRSNSLFVTMNKAIPEKYKGILMFWGNEIEDFAMKWYNADLRGSDNQDKMEEYLQSWFNARTFVANHVTNGTIKTVKCLTDRDKKGMLFSEFLESQLLYIRFEVMITTLAKNGFENDEQIIKEFLKFQNKFFSKFTDIYLDWEKLNEKCL